MKGILLAGGSGTRLHPASLAVCKQLFPVYDKPMLYYPLSLLMLAGIREICIISTPEDTPRMEKLFKDGSHLGLRLCYQVQKKPKGIAESFLIAEEFINHSPVALVLGDNILHGHDLPQVLRNCAEIKKGSVIFGYQVKNPEQYGVIEYDSTGEVCGIVEKPKSPKSSYAIPGIYFYDHQVVELAKELTPSQRGELEITDISRKYLERKELEVRLLGRGYAWLDAGTFSDLNQASCFIEAIQQRQGIQIACLEEIAYRKGWISKKELETLIASYPKNSYRDSLEHLLDGQTLSFSFA